MTKILLTQYYRVMLNGCFYLTNTLTARRAHESSNTCLDNIEHQKYAQHLTIIFPCRAPSTPKQHLFVWIILWPLLECNQTYTEQSYQILKTNFLREYSSALLKVQNIRRERLMRRVKLVNNFLTKSGSFSKLEFGLHIFLINMLYIEQNLKNYILQKN